MSDDLADRLRKWAIGAEEQGREDVSHGLRAAANRLQAAADEIEKLRVERDEARESYCLLMEAYRGGDGKVTANKLGWGYLFAEDSK